MRKPEIGTAALVVLADADPRRRHELAVTLGQAGHQVIEASTAGQATECCRATEPNLLIVNVDLHDDRGVDVLDRMRSTRALRQIPVITMGGLAGATRAAEFLRGGARDHLHPLVDRTELLARVESVLRQAEENERLRHRNEELEYLGSTDELTGLCNRRHIEDELARLGASAARHHQPLSAVLLTVDDWSSLEAAGPGCTDAILQEVAVLISAIARTGDVAGRVADHEFLVLLPMTDGSGARRFAERVRAVVAAAPVITDDGPFLVSLAAGCADGAPGPHELLQRARTALSRAVAAGGNTLVSISA